MKAAWLLAALLCPAPASAAVEVALDPRVELAAALELLGSTAPPRAFAPTGAYGQALAAGVAPCADHPAVAAYARLRRRAREDWPAQGLVALTACLDDALAVRPREDCRRSALAASAADFARACGFPKVLESARAHAVPAVARLRAAARRDDSLVRFRAYTGLEPGPTRVAASPLLEPGRAWNGVDRDGAAFSVIRALSPRPGAALDFEWSATPLEVWHENAHGHLDALLPDTAAPEGLAAAACYGSWPQCAREHLAQGLALRLARAAGGKPRLNARLPRLEAAAGALAEFEKDRARWPTLREFVPRWLEALGARPAPASTAPPPAAEAASDPRLSAALSSAQTDPEKATAALRALAAERPGDAAVLLSLAVLRRPRDQSEALALAGRAVAAAREADDSPWLLPDALTTRGTWRREAGDLVGWRVDLEEALACAPLDWPRRAETAAALAAR